MFTSDSAVYDWFGLNRGLFLFVNGLHAPIVDSLMVAVSWLGHPRLFPFYVTAMLVLAWRTPRWMPLRKIVVFALSYMLTSVLIIPIIKTAFNFPRPAELLGDQVITVLGDSEIGYSFPSGHSAFAVLTAWSLMPGVTRRTRIALVMFATLVCISRVSIGAHFPADVVVGAAIAVAVVSCVRLALGPRPG